MLIKYSRVIEPDNDGMAPRRVYLRLRREEGLPDEWVVHTRNLQTGGYYNGFYARERAVAEKEFADRCERLGVSRPEGITP